VVAVQNDSHTSIRGVSCRVYPVDGTKLNPERGGPFWVHDKALGGPAFQAIDVPGVLDAVASAQAEMVVSVSRFRWLRIPRWAPGSPATSACTGRSIRKCISPSRRTAATGDGLPPCNPACA
jgi:hypothetical protein